MLFGKLGWPKDFQVKLKISEEVKPVPRQHCWIPFQMGKALEAELAQLENLDIIGWVNEPTPWILPIIIVPKCHDQQAMKNVCGHKRSKQGHRPRAARHADFGGCHQHPE